jgi:hypothetical protein
MKTAEQQQTSDAASAQPAQPTSSAQPSEKFKKPHLKLFNNVIKPLSLSLTSLPPQSPKEASDEAQSVERPYNSLKVNFVAFHVEFDPKISINF